MPSEPSGADIDRDCLMCHEWCDGPDGEMESGVAFGGLCGECCILKMKEKENEGAADE